MLLMMKMRMLILMMMAKEPLGSRWEVMAIHSSKGPRNKQYDKRASNIQH
jgi:hypothetical protein